MLFTGCILNTQKIKDRTNISVMSRHTLNDGKTPDLRINVFDIHIPELGPSPKLIGSYYRKKIDWKIFSCEYVKELRTIRKYRIVKFLAHSAMYQDIVILCIEEKPDFCHRRLLANECLIYEPGLLVEHL